MKYNIFQDLMKCQPKAKNQPHDPTDPNKPRYFVRDQFGQERELTSLDNASAETIRNLVRTRQVTIIRKKGNAIKEFRPK